MGATPILFVLGSMALIAGVQALNTFGLRKGKVQWANIAQELGLNVVDLGSSGPLLSGLLRGFGVTVGPVGGRSLGIKSPLYVIRISVDGVGKIPSELELRAEKRLASLTKPLAGNDLLTHDAPFDAAVHIQGDEPRTLAALSHETRQTVLALLKQGTTTVNDSKIVLESNASCEEADIKGLTLLAVRLAEQLTLSTKAMPYALAKNALTDPVPQVRSRNLECLLAVRPYVGPHALSAELGYPPSQKEEVNRAAQAALSSDNPRLRLLAAMLLGEETGFAVLKELVEDDDTLAALRAPALLALASLFSRERVEPIVAGALASGSAPLQEAAVLSVGALRAAGLISGVCALLPTAAVPLQLTIAKTLGELGSDAAEAALIELLRHSADEVRVAAAQALGKVGTIRSVEPLLLVKDKLLGDVKKVALQAARAIQGRLGEVEAGRLSVVEPHDGQGALSLASSGGQLSLAQAPVSTNASPAPASKKP